MAACTAIPDGKAALPTIQDSFTNSTAIRTNGPVLATSPDAVGSAAADAARIAAFARRDATRPLPADAVPLLHGAPEGAAFLAMPRPRAFALGEPAARCPARSVASGLTPVAAAESALRRCFAALEAAEGADPDCGRAVAVLDGALLLPPAAFAYAPGVSARLISPEAGLALHLVADEAVGPDGARRLALGPADPPAEALIRPDGSAELRLGDEVWTGRRTAEGLVRGRYRERLVLTRERDGARGVLAVNWDPADWEEARARVLAPLRR
jgi:hypothetical protein